MTAWDSDRKRKKMKMKTREQKEAPYEIVQEILSRLPTKAVLRFSLVSKLWLSAASDAYFRSLHYSRMGPDPKPAILQLLLGNSKNEEEEDNVISSARDSSSGVARHRQGGSIPLCRLTAPQNYEFCNTCNGLLCFAPRDPAEPIIVRNPLTGEHVALPGAPPPIEDCHCFVALGCCSTCHRYKVFRISYHREEINVALQVATDWGVLEVCDVGCTESWRRVCRLRKPPLGKPVYVDGKIHWLVRMHRLVAEHLILSVDVCSEKYTCTTIPSVRDCRSGKLFHYCNNRFASIIFELEGCVSVAADYRLSGLFIWVLKDFQQNCWELRYSCLPLLSPYASVAMRTQEIVNVCFHDGILLLRVHHQLRHQWVMCDTRERSSTLPPRGWYVDASEILSITEGELVAGFYPSLLPAREFASCSGISSKPCHSEDSWFPKEALSMTENRASTLARYVLRRKAWNIRSNPSIVVDTSLRFL